ncbi:hypothetical protein [Sphingosinicella microcystinivorans]|uniref:hypothetical protein n=1 Tax=Sphingosinicella microcystinivorans TaxID=335406 RepID=UPI0022F3D51D|nr:hypothetical protein [Sphingosinicella microcystinivorans]WBX83772.1 hypothetical protein PE061_18590 [Sphingosinicella microcystinivorans]
MSSRNLETVHRFLDLVGESTDHKVIASSDIDFSRITALLTSEFVIRNPLFHPEHGIVKGVGDDIDGSLRGPDAIEIDLKATASLFEFSVRNAELKDAGDVILFLGNISVRGTESLRSMETGFVELFFMKDGLIDRIEPYLNVNAFRLIL